MLSGDSSHTLWVVKKLSDLEMSKLRRLKDSTVLPLNLAVKTLLLTSRMAPGRNDARPIERSHTCHLPYFQRIRIFGQYEIDMFAVMRELVRGKYTRMINPEHSRGLDADRERPDFKPQYPGGGGYTAFTYNVAYARAMLQAALSM